MDIEKIKQRILDLAIRGKLVPRDPNDEPASVLIEKIKAEKEKMSSNAATICLWYLMEGKGIIQCFNTSMVIASNVEPLPFFKKYFFKSNNI